MPEEGTLTIRTSRVDFDEDFAQDRVVVARGSYVLLQVIDTGAGVTPEQLPHTFEPFYTPRKQEKGPGSEWPPCTAS